VSVPTVVAVPAVAGVSSDPSDIHNFVFKAHAECALKKFFLPHSVIT
jgi:hypothetical protein